VGRDPIVKMFFDIEQVVPKSFYEALVKYAGDTKVGEIISADVIEALKGTLEEYDHNYDHYESYIDYAIVSRCRSVGDDDIKLSFHVITNVAMRVSECKAIARVLKEDYLSLTNDRITGYKDMLCAKNTLNTAPYRKNGGLSLPGGRKKGHQLTTIRQFERNESLHLREVYACTTLHEFSDQLPIKTFDSRRQEFEDSSSEFINKALAKLDSDPKRVPAYTPEAMDLYANPPHGNYLHVARTAPSHCSACDRTHDSSDSLLLIFNEAKEIALWKCARNDDMKASRWFGRAGSKDYDIEGHDDDDIEFFAKNLATRAARKAEAAEIAKSVDKGDKGDKEKKKKPSVVLKEKMIEVVKDMYRREFSTGVIFQKKTDYYYTRKFSDPREFLNHIFINDEMYQMCSQSDHKELIHFIKDIVHPAFPFMKLDHSYMGFKNCGGRYIPRGLGYPEEHSSTSVLRYGLECPC